jgi:hypothetical protein
MAADFTIKQGSTSPVFNTAILDSYGNRLDLTGATVMFVMRLLSGLNPTTNAAATILDAPAGMVSYPFTTSDTSGPGLYMAEFVVTLPGGAVYTYPNDGYLEISIEVNMSAPAGTELVSVADAKDYLRFQSNDRSEDAKILRFIRMCRPLIEAIAGPIIPAQFEEWHDGGHSYIMVNRRPSTAYGTTPIFEVQAISEYNGPIEWPLAIVASPDQGQLYSVQADVRFGRIVRRTAGGGVQGFAPGLQSVHVWYTAGQQSVPDNVYEATLELLRINYQQTQQQSGLRVGTGGNPDDAEPERTPIGFFMPGKVREMLNVNRRFPSLA